MAVKLRSIDGAREEGPTTPEGLPDISTPHNLQANAHLFWRGCRERAVREDKIDVVTRGGRKGYLYNMNGQAIMSVMWDGFVPSPTHDASRTARQRIYHYLKSTQNMVCERRYPGGGLWWIADTWSPEIKFTPMEGLTVRLRPGGDETGREGKEPGDLEVAWRCVHSGCGAGPFTTQGMSLHLRAMHNMLLDEYKAIGAGHKPWPAPGDDVPDDDDESETMPSADAVAAVQQLVEEVVRLRARASSFLADGSDDLAGENAQLRRELDELRKVNARLRAKVEAADRAFGRR